MKKDSILIQNAISARYCLRIYQTLRNNKLSNLLKPSTPSRIDAQEDEQQYRKAP